MKILLTFKPVEYMRNQGAYSGLARLDLDSGNLENILRLPTAAYRETGAFSVPFAQGLAVDGRVAYVGLWNIVVVVDLDTFSVTDAFSTSEMADVHSIAVLGNRILVVSTATECLLCFDKESHELLWRWGPNAKILDGSKFKFLPGFRLRNYRSMVRRLKLGGRLHIPDYAGGETRHVHKSESLFYRHHMNNVMVHGRDFFINTKGWFDSTSSSVIRLDSANMGEEFFVQPGGFIGSHDGLIYKNWYYVTEADNNSLARVDLDSGVVERFPLKPENYFIRGLAQAGDLFAVGFTPRRGSVDPPGIGYFGAEDLSPTKFTRLPDLYGRGNQLAVHSLAVDPTS